jgi:hypothetical protein
MATKSKKKATESRIGIAIAVIGVLGALGVAVINNLDKIRPSPKPDSQEQTSTSAGVPDEAAKQTTGNSMPLTSSAVIVDVPAEPKNWRLNVFTPTNILVRPGEKISFVASGTWSVGVGWVGPDGREAKCECVVSTRIGEASKGALGALIGKIGDNGTPFLIGRQKSIQAAEGGTLFLGSNDNMGPCDGVNRGSCFQNNSGTLKVRIEKR